MGPVELGAMSWRGPGSRRIAAEVTGFVGGSHGLLQVEG